MASLKHTIKTVALDGLTNEQTVQNYKKWVNAFGNWAKGEGFRTAKQVADPAALVSRYVDALRAKGYTPSTIHSYIAPVCKGLGISMNQVHKPKRSAGSIVKGRDDGKNRQGQRELTDPRNERVIRAQVVLGIRRAELAKIRGGDLVRDVNGNLCVYVIGKGGKEQRQVIARPDEAFITSLFDGVGLRQAVFSTEEMNRVRHAPLHTLRREHAQGLYEYYKSVASTPDARQELRKSLLRYFDAYHIRMDGKESLFAKQRARFAREMRDGTYVTRGENRLRMEVAGRPTEYDRLALTCVSVFHLAHWRNDVTVKNYMV